MLLGSAVLDQKGFGQKQLEKSHVNANVVIGQRLSCCPDCLEL